MEESTLTPSSSEEGHHKERHIVGFLDLPPELRSMVYDYAIGYRVVTWRLFLENGLVGMAKHIYKDFDVPTHEMNKNMNLERKTMYQINRLPDHAAVLMRTCKTLSQGILPILYHRTQFNIMKICSTFPLRRDGEAKWGYGNIEEHIPSTILTRIRHVKLDISLIRFETYRPVSTAITTALVNKLNQGDTPKTILLEFMAVVRTVWRTDPLGRSEDFVTMLKSLKFEYATEIHIPYFVECWWAVEHGIENLRVFDNGNYPKCRKAWRDGTGGKVVPMERVLSEREEEMRAKMTECKMVRDQARKAREEKERLESYGRFLM